MRNYTDLRAQSILNIIMFYTILYTVDYNSKNGERFLIKFPTVKSQFYMLSFPSIISMRATLRIINF